MWKRALTFMLVVVLISAIPAMANTGIDYLENRDLIEDEGIDFKALSLLVKSYDEDELELKERLASYAQEEGLREQAFAFFATGDSSLAQKIASKQGYHGDWDGDIYLTALISYSLLRYDLEGATSRAGLSYLSSVQKTNGAWGDSIQETALSLLALAQDGYRGQPEESGVDWLLRQQSGNGSWGSNINTAWVLLTLKCFRRL